MSVVTLAVRAWARHAPALLALSALALAPVWLVALATPAASDAAHAHAQLWLGWALLAPAWILQLVLVAGVAPAVADSSMSRRRALTAGLRAMARALLPCATAVAAIAVGMLALVLPGLALLVLLAFTGASDRLGDPLPAPLADSVRAARADVRLAVAVVAGALVLDVAIGGIAELVFAHGAKALGASRTFIRVLALALVAVSPLPACALAATYTRSREPAR